MKDKKQGILAKPGTHRGELVTVESLKRALMYHDSIPLIVGPHPPGGYAYPDTYIGKVHPKWNEEKQRVDATFWFFDEGWHLVPEKVKRKLANNEEIPLSVGYETTTDDNKTQKWRKWDHIALGVRNPLIKDVGVNVRMEEDFPKQFRIEEEDTKITGDATPEPKTVSLTPAQLQEIVDTAVIKALAAQDKKETAETEVSDEEEKAPEEPETARPDPVPEMVLPASAPNKSKDEMEGIEITPDGWWKF